MAHNNSPSQGFRVGSSAPVYIRARFDPKYGQYVILWRDVQRAFIGVSQVRHGSEVVSFLTDDDFKELLPLRVRLFPGVILEVILDGTETPPAYTPVAKGISKGGKPGRSSSGSKSYWGKIALGTGAVVGGMVAGPLLVTGTVAALGFGAGGIVAGTPAAAIMASYGGAVTAGSACAVLQSIGAAGLGAAGTAIASAVGAAAAAGGAAAAMKD